MYYGPGMGSWGIALMIVGNVIFSGLLVVAAVAVVRRAGLGQAPPSSTAEVPPQNVLAQRFARGEISEEEYLHGLQVLSRTEFRPEPEKEPRR